jgi:hypothetical protein
MEADIYTLAEYCAAEKISRAQVYKEWAAGEGVEFFKRGAKIFISNEARLRHRALLEQLEREKREKREKARKAAAPEAA